MKKKYLQIFRLADPYYKKGRAAEKEHHLVVMEMMQKLLKENKKFDNDVMIVSALLHDIGYSKIPKDKRAGHWNKNVKKNHMLFGGQLANKILISVGFPQQKINKVIEIIKIHDNPEIGLDINLEEAKLLKEADILWMTTEQAFWLDVGRRMINPEDWLNTLGKRFTKDPRYNKYLKTKYAKNKVKHFIKTMKKKLMRT